MTRDTARKTDNFEQSANKTMAKSLKGHLLLMHGDMDDNLHPANTIQLVDELIKANRATPPDNYEITRPPDAAGGPGGVTPDDDPSSWR